MREATTSERKPREKRLRRRVRTGTVQPRLVRRLVARVGGGSVQPMTRWHLQP